MPRFISKFSADYLNTVNVLRELEKKEQNASRAYADAVWSSVKEDWIKSNGVISSKRRVCIGTLMGKQSCRGCKIDRCMPPGADHSSLWEKGGVPEVFVTQPYVLSFEKMKELVDYCNELGLTANISTWPGWHFPGQAMLIEIRKGNGHEIC